MASIGSFGAAIREFDPDAEKDTFEFFGETFTVQAAIPPMLMLHLGAAIAGKAGRMEGNAAIWQALRCALTGPGEDDEDGTQFDRFYWLAVRRKASEDELVNLVFTLVGAQAGKVDALPPTSPDGPPPTSPTSSSPPSDTPDSPALVSVEDRLAGLV